MLSFLSDFLAMLFMGRNKIDGASLLSNSKTWTPHPPGIEHGNPKKAFLKGFLGIP